MVIKVRIVVTSGRGNDGGTMEADNILLVDLDDVYTDVFGNSSFMICTIYISYFNK